MTTNDTRFDRLVDDELPEAERRELLGGLDDEPDGWRRCALAFLEAQCWRRSLGSLAAKGFFNAKPSSPKVIATPRRRTVWSHRVGMLLAMAASFLVMFVAVTAVQRMRSPSSPDASRQVAVNVGGQSASGERSAASPAPSQSRANPWRMVTMSMPSDAGKPGAALRLPAVERDKLDRKWLQNLPPAMPDDVVRAFNRTGHQVEQHRELVPMPLQDGRQMVVPVDQVNVRYVGDKAY